MLACLFACLPLCPRYVVTKSMDIKKRISFKGDGSDKVELIVTKSPGGSVFSYKTNLFSAKTKLTDVSAGAKRGTNEIKVGAVHAQSHGLGQRDIVEQL
jgi:hypothetical protein